MSELNFSDEVLDTQNDFETWEPAPEFAPPPAAGTYQMYISEIRDEKEQMSGVGLRYFATVDLRIIGGQYDDRAVTFQRFNNVEFQRRDGKRSSFLLDLLKCAGIAAAPRSNREFSQALHSLYDRGVGASFKAQLDWEGSCSECYEKKLMELTGLSSGQNAKDNADKAQKAEAGKFSRKAKNYRAFPTNDNGTRKDTFICPDCGNEVRAMVRITRFLPS